MELNYNLNDLSYNEYVKKIKSLAYSMYIQLRTISIYDSVSDQLKNSFQIGLKKIEDELLLLIGEENLHWMCDSNSINYFCERFIKPGFNIGILNI